MAVGVPLAIEGAVATAGARWYGSLVKPSFAPPLWLAEAGALSLGLILAAAFVRVLRAPDYLPDRPGAIRSCLVMLALGIVWAVAFFSGRHPTLGLLGAFGATLACAMATWRFATVDRRAGWMLSPVLLASCFALLVELSISVKNG